MNGQTQQYQKSLPFWFLLCAENTGTGGSSPSAAGLILVEGPPTAASTPMFKKITWQVSPPAALHTELLHR